MLLVTPSGAFPRALSIHNDGKPRIADDEDCCLALLPLRPWNGNRRGESSFETGRYFGGPANSESPVALRPSLTRGLPFRSAIRPNTDRLTGASQELCGGSTVLPTRLQPRRHLRMGERADQATLGTRPVLASARPALTAAIEYVDRNTGCARKMSSTHSSHRRPKRCPVFRDPAVTSANVADHACPSATVADPPSLPPELLDAFRDVCHPCHPLSGAIGITLVGSQLNMADPASASVPWIPRSSGLRISWSGAIWAPDPRNTRVCPGVRPTIRRSESDEDHGLDADTGGIVAVQERWVPSRDRTAPPRR